MPKVVSFAIVGIELCFYSSDHAPPHFHAEKAGEWNIRVFIETTTVRELHYATKWPRNPPPHLPSKLEKLLRDKTVTHRAALLQEWQDKVSTP